MDDQKPTQPEFAELNHGVTQTDKSRESGVIIDLTGEDEQERQSLLSSFKMRGPASATY